MPTSCAREAHAKITVKTDKAKKAAGVVAIFTGAGADGVFRWYEAEVALAQEFASGALDRVVANRDQLLSDIHAAADYRAHLMMVMTRRAVANCS